MGVKSLLFYWLNVSQRIEHSLTQLHSKVDLLMTQGESILQLITDIDDATNDVADKLDLQGKTIKNLQDQIAAGQAVTPDQLAAISVGLNAEVARLRTLGSDVTDPIPTP